MVYLPTQLGYFWVNVGKYSSTMEHMSILICITPPGPSKAQYFLFDSPVSHFWMWSPRKSGIWPLNAKANASEFLTFDDGQGGMTASSDIHRQLEGGCFFGNCCKFRAFWSETTPLSDITLFFKNLRAEIVAKRPQKWSKRQQKPSNGHKSQKVFALLF